ncbi:MAG TPA: secretin N-terminal domain-containing protein [Candidatus Baltobacteraceae bacterium]|nr:secretin N-terminal domain-containing protein [Candidatus Baltobacteraceae bacterium]
MQARRMAVAPTPNAPAVVTVNVITVDRAADIVRRLYPQARITVDRSANSLIVVASPEVENNIRTIVSGIDVKNPRSYVSQAQQLHHTTPQQVIPKLKALYPNARFAAGPNKTVLISATQQDEQEIDSIVASIDTPLTTPAPSAAPAEVVRVLQRRARDVAREVAVAVPGVRVSVSGADVILAGPSDGVAHAKDLVAQLDEPQSTFAYTQIYRLRYVDAASVAGLLRRSFGSIDVNVDKDLNALSIRAPAALQKRIADGLAQLDGGDAPAAQSGGLPVAQPGTSSTAYSGPNGASEVYTLRAAVPGLNGAPSTSATDLATTVTQALSSQAPDLKITVPPNANQMILTGSPYSIRLAKDLINQLDVAEPLVVLDTEVLEVDETVAKNLGLQFSQPVVSSTFTETSPSIPLDGGTPPPQPIGLLPFTRSPLTLGLQLNLLIQRGYARILSDPRITTVSGRTASIRAGDTISVLTTAGGGAGTVATTQIQSFQTGVTLDITPVVNAGNFITVSLHPTVNNLSGILNGVPQISTRDTTTTVGLQADQTLIIGGLIEDTENRTESRIPILGDIPLVGHIFRNKTVNSQRNELVITVTPHIVEPGNINVMPGPPLPAIPTAQPLPTLAPGTTLPTPRPTLPPTFTPAPSPEPALTPAPPLPQQSPSPRAGSPAATRTPSPAQSGAPAPLPTAFRQLNTFTYGQAPQSNFAKPGDPVQIFYAQVSPTVVKNGDQISVSVITTTNVNHVTFGLGTITTDVKQIGPGQFQGTFPFSSGGVAFGSAGQVQMALRAYRTDGALATIPVPVSVTF